MEKLSLIDEILAKLPSQWSEEEWKEVREALCKGYLKVSSRAVSMDKLPPEAVRQILEPFVGWPTAARDAVEAMKWKTVDSYTNRQPCAIEELFKQNPGASSVMMVCMCPKCTIYCSSNS